MHEKITYQYTIKQLPVSHPMKFRTLKDTNPDELDYVPVWNDEISVSPESPIELVLDQIFEKFNVDHPKHYASHSLSVSDLVTISIPGSFVKHFICERIGWRELFVKEEKEVK